MDDRSSEHDDSDAAALVAEQHALVVAKRLRSLHGYAREPLVALALNATRAVASRRGVPPPDLGNDLPHEPLPFDELLADEDRWLRSASEDEIGHYLSELARALAAVEQAGARERITSKALVDVITTIVSARAPDVGDRAIRVFDPAAGTGTLLIGVAESIGPRRVSVSGQDINASMSIIATANAFLAGIDATFASQDSLVVDGFPEDSFDLAIADPPHGLSWSPVSANVDARRFPAGFPKSSDSSLLFAQVLLSKLRLPEEGGGRAIMLCHPGPLSEASGSPLRAWLLERDLVEAIVALPEQLSTETSIRLFALVLNNAKPSSWTGIVQVVDLRGSYVDAPSEQPERRRLTDVAFRELRRAFERPLPSAVARPVALDHFRFGTIDVTHSAVSLQGRGAPLVVPASIPLHLAPDEWSRGRYGAGPSPVLSIRVGDTEVRLDISTVFPDPLDREAPTEIRRLDWPHTTLACIASGFGYIRSARTTERDSEVAAFASGGPYLAIPVESHKDAIVIDSLEAAPDSRCFIIESDQADRVDVSFVAAWLNASGGRAARRSALVRAGAVPRGASISVRTMSRLQVAQFIDDVVIPLPTMDTQQAVALTTQTIELAMRAVSAASEELWQSPTDLNQLRRRLQPLSEPEGLTEWAQLLPAPLAGSLWIYETEKHDALKATGHLLRFWEATAEFHAAIFLSVLEGDPVLRAAEFRSLRVALSKAGMSLDRATFGTWAMIAQRLAATFRKELESDAPDASNRMLQLFADPPTDVLGRLLAPEVGRLLSEVNKLRNDWLGHAGATTDDQARKQVDVLVRHTNALRDLMTSVWDQYRLVRAGRMAMRDGRFHVEVELVRGASAPFRRKDIVVAEPMHESRLYLTMPDRHRAIPLNDLIVLRAAPRSSTYTSYFYSRSESSGIRMVAYQYADENSVVEEMPGIRGLLADFSAHEDD